MGEFEASFMRLLIDKFDVSPEQVGRLLAEECQHGGDLVTRAVAMKLADGRRLCHLLCQYWERPYFNLSFPYRRFLIHVHRPIERLLEMALLPLDFADDAVTVVGCYVPEDEVLADLSTHLGRPVILLLAEAERVAEGLKLLHERLRRLADAQTVDCGADKQRFIDMVEIGWPALLHENFAGSTIRTEFNHTDAITKTVEALDPSEPEELVSYLVGKAMVHALAPDDDIGQLINSFVQSLAYFEGELKDAILRLRMAPMLLEEQEE